LKPKWHVCYRVIQHVSHMLLKAHLVWRTNKLILLHTILHDETPLYLLNEILLQANHQSSYNLRLNRVFEPPFCNTTSYKCSCFPNVIDSWNLLDVDTQNQHSRLMFKKQIRSNISVPPPILPWVQENTTYSIVNLETWQVTWTNTSSCHTCQMVQGVLVGIMLKTTFTTFMSVQFLFAKEFCCLLNWEI
jgi:hypothetical protein